MRVLVAGDSLPDAGGRARFAAAGLAQRGHEVIWLGARPPLEELTRTRGGLSLARHDAQVIVAGDRSPLRTAAAAWLARAGAALLRRRPLGVGLAALDRTERAVGGRRGARGGARARDRTPRTV